MCGSARWWTSGIYGRYIELVTGGLSNNKHQQTYTNLTEETTFKLSYSRSSTLLIPKNMMRVYVCICGDLRIRLEIFGNSLEQNEIMG